MSSWYTCFKSKIHNHHVSQVFVPRISTCKDLFKEIVSMNNNAPGGRTSFGWDEIYLQNKTLIKNVTNW